MPIKQTSPYQLQHDLRASRRQALKVGGAGMLGLNMPGLLRASEKPSLIKPRAKRVIFLFQWGGPSPIDMFDMKPDAPADIRSPYQPIQSVVSGLPVCEHLPRMAKIMDRVTLIRSVHHSMKHHNSAGYYALSGHEPPSDDQRLRDLPELYPAYGSVVDRLSPSRGSIPTFVSFPHVLRDGSITPGQHASFLGKAHDPLFFKEDPNSDDFKLPQLSVPADLDSDRLTRRRDLQKFIDNQSRLLDDNETIRGFDQYYDKALNMLTSSKVRKAFDLSQEKDDVREKYGRTTYGQSVLLARRLAESGVKFTTVYFSNSIGGRKIGTGGWDTHGFDDSRMYKIVDKYHFPVTEQTYPTLLLELEERGLLDETLVVWMGEFGRTPKINKNESRDHWPHCYTVMLAGGGVKRGHIYGASDKYTMAPDEDPVKPEDLAATIYYLLGISPETEILNKDNRPLPIGGRVIMDILA
tara:strand:- start:78 stop:1475 length:1398 start_codon:yes stop_codon:yes gene_type:complete